MNEEEEKSEGAEKRGLVGVRYNDTAIVAWNLADIFMGIQAFINIVVIFLLGKWAFAALDDYKAQKAQGLDPVFVADNFPGMPATECWHETREELPTIDEGIVFGGGEE